ncbi:MAG: transposase, partial [Polyangia bacterium]
MIFDYFGGVLEKSFFFAVNNEDMVALHQKVQYWVDCVKAQRVFVGVEVAGCYHNAIADALEKLGYEVNLVNSYTTSCERKKMLDYSKTDDKDLMAIGQAIIANNGISPKRVTGYYEQMQLICRTRRQHVTEASALKTQIRQLMTMLFREFQGLVDPAALKKQKIFNSFWSRESRMIMRHCPLPDEILQLGKTGLQQLSAAEGLRLKDHEIELLFKAARRALAAPCPDWARFQDKQVQFRLNQLEVLEERITALEFQMEDMLVNTPAVLLLTIKGINI